MVSPLLLAVLLTAAAAAPQAKHRPPAKSPQPAPQASAVEQGFPRTLEEASKAFLAKQALPTLSLPADPGYAERHKAAIEGYAELSARAAYVQAGRPEADDLATFHAFVRKVAKDLKADPEQSVAIYGYLVRGAGAPPMDPTVEKAVRAEFLADLLSEPKLPPEQQKRLAQSLERARLSLGQSLSADDESIEPGSVINGWVTQNQSEARPSQSGPRRVTGPSMRMVVPPDMSQAPAQAGSVLAYLDWPRAKALAAEAWENAKRFTGKCYHYVKDALDSILPSGWRSDVGQNSAFQFAKSLNSDPRLFDKLKLRRVSAQDLPGGVPPIGSIIVYGANQCGFNRKHGHIEIVVSQNPAKACSDGCADIDQRRLNCIQNSGQSGAVNVYVPVRGLASATP